MVLAASSDSKMTIANPVSSFRVQYPATNPLGVDFGGSWVAAALVAVLAHSYIFYGFESAGDVAEETKNASRQPGSTAERRDAQRRRRYGARRNAAPAATMTDDFRPGRAQR